MKTALAMLLLTGCAHHKPVRAIAHGGEDNPYWSFVVDERFVQDTFGPTALEQCRTPVAEAYTCSGPLGTGVTLIVDDREVRLVVVPAFVRRSAPEEVGGKRAGNTWFIHCSSEDCPLEVSIEDVPP